MERVNQGSEPPPPDAARTIGRWMIVLLWILALAGGSLMAQRWLDARAQAQAPRLLIESNGLQALVLQEDRYGQYLVLGRANGEAMEFLVDTGASGISIPEKMAKRLGLRRGRAFDVTTANGTLKVYATRLDTLAIGPFVRQDVQAHINPAMQGEVALLGMNYLRHYELLQRSGTLTIRQP